MTPRKEDNLETPIEHANVTGGIEHHKYMGSQRTAQILREMGFGYLAHAFDSNYQRD